ncbi:acyl-CoA thioesterase-2 [Arcanobacterium wilhelmae]|uniref:Acyl-CoA thioesterase-2 n=1 Tax=Arcanobacterium wilhelmae TaxID=1803177 RepID=A0ABT9N9K0_9ACTO|nr:acyl-CoA thioesterase domain-containing protein [Arcanobacterium wilhelmae]MDP9800381.1 acyl-CoA thioesterase-2 [Arcanobacterium wilhelmae]
MATYLTMPQTDAEPLGSVLRTLQLREISFGTYEGNNLNQVTGRVYGGQVFAQAVIAAAATLGNGESDREIHSITAAFLRPGDLREPVHFEVEEILDGRSFSTRIVHASQGGRMIFNARASFQEVQPGVEHESPTPHAPDPVSLASSTDFFANLDLPVARMMNSTNAVDIRHVQPPLWVRPAPATSEPNLIWFRLRSPLPEAGQTLQRALLAYATDQFMLEPIMRMHGMFWLDPAVSLATLDHQIWWHRDVDMSDWVLAELSSPSAQGGRGLAVAKFFQKGRHVATMSQEGMVRRKDSRG